MNPNLEANWYRKRCTSFDVPRQFLCLKPLISHVRVVSVLSFKKAQPGAFRTILWSLQHKVAPVAVARDRASRATMKASGLLRRARKPGLTGGVADPDQVRAGIVLTADGVGVNPGIVKVGQNRGQFAPSWCGSPIVERTFRSKILFT